MDIALIDIASMYPSNIVSKELHTSMNSDRMSRCYVRDDIYQLVIEEFESRTDYDVIFFTSWT